MFSFSGLAAGVDVWRSPSAQTLLLGIPIRLISFKILKTHTTTFHTFF